MANKKRLIDANALERSFELSARSWGRDCNSNAPVISRTYEAALRRVENAPTVDAVEVVRCKDCRKEGTEDCPMVRKDPIFGNLYAETKADDFCSYGERREGE